MEYVILLYLSIIGHYLLKVLILCLIVGIGTVLYYLVMGQTPSICSMILGGIIGMIWAPLTKA